jgi:hypothetical protein
VKCSIEYYRGKQRIKRIKYSNKTKKYCPTRKLGDGRRISLNRYLMEKRIGRHLKPAESVHHIDMDKENNETDCLNYYLYPNESEHMKGHHSLEKLVSSLLKDRIIKFKDGKYYRFL